MKGIGIIALLLQSALVLCCIVHSMGLVPQPHEHHRRKETPPVIPASSSRRSFGIVASASLSSLLVGDGSCPSAFSARANIVDILNSPIGSPDLLNDLRNELSNKPTSIKAMPPQATIQKAKDWTLPRFFSDLGDSRINTDTVLPLPNSLPFTRRDTLYPSAFVGDWVVRAMLKQKTLPFGSDFLPSRALVEGSPNKNGEQVGDSTSYILRYIPVSTSGETFAVADRAFNLVSMNSSYQKDSPIVAGSVRWDSNKDPTKLVFRTESSENDQSLLQTEVALTSRVTEDRTRTMLKEARVFAYAERNRVVTTTTTTEKAKSVVVADDDCEVITEFRNIGPDTIQAVSRIAVYLLPNQGASWSQVKGKAVAIYDYELTMQRQQV